MRAEIDAEAEAFPDLLALSATTLRAILGDALGEVPAWARPLAFEDYFGVRHRRFIDQLADMLGDEEGRVTVNRGSGELTISFGGDTKRCNLRAACPTSY